MSRYKVRALRKPFRYWYPGIDFISEIVKRYGGYIENGDIIVISEKALAVALGWIYDEKALTSDIFTKLAAYLINKVFWSRVMRRVFKLEQTVLMLKELPIDVIAIHKKLALRYGGLKHFLKPLSEAGIDATNLPYRYVSLPLRNADSIAENIRIELFKRLGKATNILIIDTDKTYVMKGLRGVAFATRYSTLKNIIDLGGIGYILGKVFRKKFSPYPTPVAYKGVNLPFSIILRICRLAERLMGHGLGRTAIEMLRNMDRASFDEITWADMAKVKHYPVLLVRLKIEV